MSTTRDRIVDFRRVPASDLLPNPKNPRTHGDDQRAALSSVLEEIGIVDAVIARETPEGLQLIDGHLRQETLTGDVPVIVVDLDDNEADTILATFDPIGAMAGTSEELLGELLAGIESESDAIMETLRGISIDAGLPQDEPEPVDAEPEIDRADELREAWGVEAGQLWLLGSHRLLCGDCTKAADVKRLMDGAKADMVLTDPPYGVGYKGGGGLTIENDDLKEPELKKMLTKVFDICQRISRPGAYWYSSVPAGPKLGVFLYDWIRRGILRQEIIWVKDSMVMGGSEYHYQHESILFGWMPADENHKRHRNRDRTRTTVWPVDRPKASREHPTVKPVALWVLAMKDGSRRREAVYDPFVGSGTTIIAAEQLGRRCYALEISPAYVAVCLQRYQDATGVAPTLDGTR